MSINAEWVRDEIQALQADNAALREQYEQLQARLAEAERLLTYVVRYSNAKSMLSPGFIDDVQALFAGRRSAATEDALDAALKEQP